MFSWICPKCGTDVPPSYDDCPKCAAAAADERAARGAAPAPASPAPAPDVSPVHAVTAVETQAPPPPPPAPVPAAAPAPQGHVIAAPKPAIPSWLLSVVLTLLFAGVIGGALWGIKAWRGSKPAFEPVPEAAEASGAKGAAARHPLEGRIEVAGFRVLEPQQGRLELQFVLINHSGAEIGNLEGTIELRTQARGEERPFVTFAFKSGEIKPYGIKEMRTNIRTSLRAYELPDWQFLKPELRLTGP